MNLMKLFIAGLIILGILVLGGLIVLAIIGFFAVSFVQWLEANPAIKALFVLVGLVLTYCYFLKFLILILSHSFEFCSSPGLGLWYYWCLHL